MDMQFSTAGEILCAPGLASTIGARAQALGMARVLLVSDTGVAAAGLLDAAEASLAEAGICFTRFTDVVADPPTEVVLGARDAALAMQADGVIAIGGGSALDVAKLAALLARSGEPLESIYGVGNAKGPRLPLILVPTTAGTGSEVTQIAIVTVSAAEKKGVVSPLLLPDVALLDPELTVGLPPAVTAATGIDAMVHAIEAYTSRHRKNPASDALAREALRLLWRGVPRAWCDGADMAARTDALLGACLAGMAFANAPVAAVHALAYPLGARHHIAHGSSNALVLTPVLRFNLPAAAPLYAELAPLIGVSTSGSGMAALADAFVAALETQCLALKVPRTLAQAGITAPDIDQLADDAMLQTRLLVNNPREVTRADAYQIYAGIA